MIMYMTLNQDNIQLPLKFGNKIPFNLMIVKNAINIKNYIKHVFKIVIYYVCLVLYEEQYVFMYGNRKTITWILTKLHEILDYPAWHVDPMHLDIYKKAHIM